MYFYHNSTPQSLSGRTPFTLCFQIYSRRTFGREWEEFANETFCLVLLSNKQCNLRHIFHLSRPPHPWS